MAKTYTRQQLKITPDWRSCVFALLLLPVLLSLGFWQLDRAEEKSRLKELYRLRQESPPLVLTGLEVEQELQYQPVVLKGHYLNDIQMFVDNSMHKGKFGYEVVTPFQLLGSEQLLMINRGWIEGDKSRRTLPPVEPVDGEVSLTGELYQSPGKPFALGEQSVQPWPRVLQYLDMKALAEELQANIFPYTVRLKMGSPGAYQDNWLVVNVQPEKHTAYAFQWFAMATALVVIVLLLNTNIITLLKRKE